MSIFTAAERLTAFLAAVALAAVLIPGSALAEQRRCDSDPSAHNCRRGDEVKGVGELFQIDGATWRVAKVNGGTWLVRVEPADGASPGTKPSTP